MRGCSPPPDESDRLRYLAFTDMGCICCTWKGHPRTPAEVHHIVQADNQQTLPLCAWHHRGIPVAGMGVTRTAERLGPSLELHKREFEAYFGTEEQLLEAVNRRVQAILHRERVA